MKETPNKDKLLILLSNRCQLNPKTDEELYQNLVDILEHHFNLFDKSAKCIEHSIQTYVSQAARGAYPLELMEGTQYFTGLAGFEKQNAVLQQVKLVLETKKEKNNV